MSSAGRGAVRQEHDYYVTPVPMIVDFLRVWHEDDPEARRACESGCVLDPCAGGNAAPVRWLYKPAKNGKSDEFVDVPPSRMSYPDALVRVVGAGVRLLTNDVREDSPASLHVDFVREPGALSGPFDVVMTNPPFALAMDVISVALGATRPGGFVVMFLRLNFLESDDRFEFFSERAPERVYVHHKRVGFIPGRKGQDSIAYAHMVWRAGRKSNHATLRVI